MTGALDTIGNLLNIGGILVALFGLILESRQRRWPVLGKRGQRLRHMAIRVWARLRRKPPQVVAIGTAKGHGLALGGTAFGLALKPVNAEAPLSDLLDALQYNMREMLKSSEAKQDWLRERQAERIEALKHRLDATNQRITDESSTEREIASRSLRLEVWGLAVALLGTGVSSVASLLGSTPSLYFLPCSCRAR